MHANVTAGAERQAANHFCIERNTLADRGAFHYPAGNSAGLS